MNYFKEIITLLLKIIFALILVALSIGFTYLFVVLVTKLVIFVFSILFRH